MSRFQKYCKWCMSHGELNIFNGGHIYSCHFYRCTSCKVCDGPANASNAARQPNSGLCTKCWNHGITTDYSPWHSKKCRYVACSCIRCTKGFCAFCRLHGFDKYDVGQHAKFCKFRGSCPCGKCIGERRRQGLAVKDPSAPVVQSVATQQEKPVSENPVDKQKASVAQDGKPALTQNEEILPSSKPNAQCSSSLNPTCVYCKFHGLKKYDVGQHAKFCKFQGSCPCGLCIGERRRQGLAVKDPSAPVVQSVATQQEKPVSGNPGDKQKASVKQDRKPALNGEKGPSSKTSAQCSISLNPLCVFCKFHDWKKYDVGQHAKFCKFRGDCLCGRCVGERRRQGLVVKDPPSAVVQSEENHQEKPVAVKRGDNEQKKAEDQSGNSMKKASNQQSKPQDRTALPESTKCDTLTSTTDDTHRTNERCKRKGDGIVLPKPKRTCIAQKSEALSLEYCLYCRNHGWKFPMKSHHADVCMYKRCRCDGCRKVRSDLKTCLRRSPQARTTVSPPRKPCAVVPPKPRLNTNSFPQAPVACSLPDSAPKQQHFAEKPTLPLKLSTTSEETAQKSSSTVSVPQTAAPVLEASVAASVAGGVLFAVADEVKPDAKHVAEDASLHENLHVVQGGVMDEVLKSAAAENEKDDCEVVVMNGENFAVLDQVGGDSSSDESGNKSPVLSEKDRKTLSDPNLTEIVADQTSSMLPLEESTRFNSKDALSCESENKTNASIKGFSCVKGEESICSSGDSTPETCQKPEDSDTNLKETKQGSEASTVSPICSVGNLELPAKNDVLPECDSVFSKPSAGATRFSRDEKSNGSFGRETKSSTSSCGTSEVRITETSAETNTSNEAEGTLSQSPADDGEKTFVSAAANGSEHEAEERTKGSIDAPSTEAENLFSCAAMEVANKGQQISSKPPVDDGQIKAHEGTKDDASCGASDRPFLVGGDRALSKASVEVGAKLSQRAISKRDEQHKETNNENEASTVATNASESPLGNVTDTVISRRISEDSCTERNSKQCEIASLLNDLAEFGKNLKPYERYARSANASNIFSNLSTVPQKCVQYSSTPAQSTGVAGNETRPPPLSVLASVSALDASRPQSITVTSNETQTTSPVLAAASTPDESSPDSLPEASNETASKTTSPVLASPSTTEEPRPQCIIVTNNETQSRTTSPVLASESTPDDSSSDSVTEASNETASKTTVSVLASPSTTKKSTPQCIIVSNNETQSKTMSPVLASASGQDESRPESVNEASKETQSQTTTTVLTSPSTTEESRPQCIGAITSNETQPQSTSPVLASGCSMEELRSQSIGVTSNESHSQTTSPAFVATSTMRAERDNHSPSHEMGNKVDETEQNKEHRHRCWICGKIFSSSQQLRLHNYFKHQLDPEANGSTNKCRNCSFETPNLLALDDHESAHMNLVPLQSIFSLFSLVRQVRSPQANTAEN